LSSRRAVHLLTFVAVLAVAATVGVQAQWAQTRVETTARSHAMRLAAVTAAAAQAAHDAPRVMDAALEEHMAAHAALVLEMADLAAAAKVPDRDMARRLEGITARTTLQALWLTDNKGNIRIRAGARAGEDENATSALTLWPAFAEALAKPGKPLTQASEQSEEDGKTMRRVGLADGRGGAAVTADGGRVAELARLLGVDGLIDGVLGAQAADSLWLLDREGRVLAQGALVAQAGGAFADPDPAAAALAREVTTQGKAAALIDYGGGVDGVFAAAPLVDRNGERLGAALIRLPLEGRREAEREAAALAAAAVAALALAGFALGRVV
jgi:phosphoserine phosphatase RsbU/P